MLIDGLFELPSQIRHLAEHGIEVFARESQQYTWRDRPYGDVGRLIRCQIGLAEELTFGQ